jgi:hypothetical protein
MQRLGHKRLLGSGAQAGSAARRINLSPVAGGEGGIACARRRAAKRRSAGVWGRATRRGAAVGRHQHVREMVASESVGSDSSFPKVESEPASAIASRGGLPFTVPHSERSEESAFGGMPIICNSRFLAARE